MLHGTTGNKRDLMGRRGTGSECLGGFVSFSLSLSAARIHADDELPAVRMDERAVIERNLTSLGDTEESVRATKQTAYLRVRNE